MIPEFSLKRDAGILEVADERPFKKKRATSTNDDDMDWLKQEIGDIKEGMKKITKHLKGNVDYKLDELLQYIGELS